MEREGTSRINGRLAREHTSSAAAVGEWSETEKACKLQGHLPCVPSRTRGGSSVRGLPHLETLGGVCCLCLNLVPSPPPLLLVEVQ